MATYNKKLKTIVVHLLLDDASPITIADTADDDKATRALNEFKKYGTMHYENNGKTNAVPYHAVQYIEVTEEDTSVTKDDPYGCENGGGDTVTVTFDLCGYVGDVPMPITVNKGETITLPVVWEDPRTNAWCASCVGSEPWYGQGSSYVATEDTTLYWANTK